MDNPLRIGANLNVAEKAVLKDRDPDPLRRHGVLPSGSQQPARTRALVREGDHNGHTEA